MAFLCWKEEFGINHFANITEERKVCLYTNVWHASDYSQQLVIAVMPDYDYGQNNVSWFSMHSFLF